MKLLIITHALEKGGAEKLIVDSLPFYKKNNIDVEILLFNSSMSVPTHIDGVRKDGIIVHDLSIRYLYSPGVAWGIRSFLKRQRCDVVHVHLFPALYWASLAVKGWSSRPLMIFTEHSNHNKRRNYRFFKPVERFFYNSYDRIIAITDNVRERLVNWVGLKDSIVTIENGVDIESIKHASIIERSELCKQLGIPDSSKLILMTASFQYPKDQNTLIKAGEILGENFHILLAGEGEMREKTEQMVKSLSMQNRVHFLGFRTDIRSLMKSIDLNVLSTEYEGMSGVALEALASGRVFLGSDVPGVKELVPDSRFLFPPSDYSSLALQIRNLLANQEFYDELSELGLENVKQFDMQSMVESYLGLYTSLLNK